MDHAEAVEVASPTVRGGGWDFTVPEDVVNLSSSPTPFPLHEDLDPKVDPFVMVEAASRLIAEQIRMEHYQDWVGNSLRSTRPGPR